MRPGHITTATNISPNHYCISEHVLKPHTCTHTHTHMHTQAHPHTSSPTLTHTLSTHTAHIHTHSAHTHTFTCPFSCSTLVAQQLRKLVLELMHRLPANERKVIQIYAQTSPSPPPPPPSPLPIPSVPFIPESDCQL